MSWRYYIPSVVFFGLAGLFAVFPILAAAILVTGFALLGSVYAFFVSRIRAQMRQVKRDGVSVDWEGREPSFRNITVHMVRRSQWLDARDNPGSR